MEIEALKNNQIINFQCSMLNFQVEYLLQSDSYRVQIGVVFKLKSNLCKKEMIKPVSTLEGAYKETEELIAIIAKSIITAKKNSTF